VVIDVEVGPGHYTNVLIGVGALPAANDPAWDAGLSAVLAGIGAPPPLGSGRPGTRRSLAEHIEALSPEQAGYLLRFLATAARERRGTTQPAVGISFSERVFSNAADQPDDILTVRVERHEPLGSPEEPPWTLHVNFA
jgi:hypothetical protein